MANLSDMKEHKIYFGKKFYKNSAIGYWQSTKSAAIYAHRWVWMMYFGEIPKGMVIHHIDGNPSNNEITNLQMLKHSDHIKYHWRRKKYNHNQLLLAI